MSLALALGLAAATGASAQTLEDRLRSQLVAVTAQLRDAQASQAALTEQKDAAEKARDTLKAQLVGAQAQARAAKRVARPAAPSPAELEPYKSKAEQLAQAHAQDQSDLAAAQAQAAHLQEEVARLQAEQARSAAALTSGETGLAECKAKNVQALQVAKDILAAYDRVSVGGVLARKEPFTGLKRVQIEQLEQDYGDRIYDSGVGVSPRKPAPAAGDPAPKPPPK